MIFGCAATPEGPKHLYPEESGAPGYYTTEEASIFENDLAMISLRPLRQENNATYPPIIEELLDKNYAIFIMTIENRSPKKAIYNPTFTSLRDNHQMEYRKPMDYTDLYDVVKDRKEGVSPESELRGLKGKFYDLNTTIPTGQKTSKLLIFRPLSEKAKSAVLTIREFYVGTDTISASFLFSVREAEGSEQ
jgi:hypothetical protein